MYTITGSAIPLSQSYRLRNAFYPPLLTARNALPALDMKCQSELQSPINLKINQPTWKPTTFQILAHSNLPSLPY